MKNKYALGIDFGTTKSYLVRIVENGLMVEVAHYESEFGANLTPTNARAPFSRDATSNPPVPTIIGIDTRGQPNYYSGFQALDMDRDWYGHLMRVSNLKERLANWNEDAERLIPLEGKEPLPAEGLAGRFISDLVTQASFEEPFDQLGVTITVPAKSPIHQRMATRFAANIAGFKDQSIALLEEPIAAFLYYRHLYKSYFETGGRPENALVIDFGGGTCDLAVIEYDNTHLPIVKGRSMAYLGGNHIDDLLLSELWLPNLVVEDPQSLSKDTRPISKQEFETWQQVHQLRLRAYARSVKEDLSRGRESSVKMHGVLPAHIGNVVSPYVTLDQFAEKLEKTTILIQYDNSTQKSLSVKDHIIHLIENVLDDAQIKRNAIHKLIFAGGSIQLLKLKDWVRDYFTGSGYEGPANTILWSGEGASTVFDQQPEICVAGGAAVHQLYRNSRDKKQRKVIVPTLSADYWIRYPSQDPQQPNILFLGKQKDELPIVRNNFFSIKGVTLCPLYRSDEEGIEIEIGQGNPNRTKLDWQLLHRLKPHLGGSGLLDALRKALIIEYTIDEFGVLEEMIFIPGNLFSSWQFFKRERINGYDPELAAISLTKTEGKKRVQILKKRLGIKQ